MAVQSILAEIDNLRFIIKADDSSLDEALYIRVDLAIIIHSLNNSITSQDLCNDFLKVTGEFADCILVNLKNGRYSARAALYFVTHLYLIDSNYGVNSLADFTYEGLKLDAFPVEDEPELYAELVATGILRYPSDVTELRNAMDIMRIHCNLLARRYEFFGSPIISATCTTRYSAACFFWSPDKQKNYLR